MEYIEGYDLLEKLGEGGMGQAYRALHRRLDRQVAIKRLAPELSHNQDMLEHFLQEARLQARLPQEAVVADDWARQRAKQDTEFLNKVSTLLIQARRLHEEGRDD